MIASLGIFFAILFVLVIVHELGHFLFAKMFKIRVDEFAFGFPPRIFSFKKGETEYSFNAIPLGGYVKIFGENGLDDKDVNETDKKRAFTYRSPFQKILVLIGGVLFNLIFCVIVFSIVSFYDKTTAISVEDTLTIPSSERYVRVVSLLPESNLKKAGLGVGDDILSIEHREGIFIKTIDGDALNSQTFANEIKAFNDASFTINTKDNKQGYTREFIVSPQAGLVDGKKILGVGVADIVIKDRTIIESIKFGFLYTYEQFIFILNEMGKLLKGIFTGTGSVEESLSGPIGIAHQTKEIANEKFDKILFFAGILSLSLAVFNILPLPALDGGRIFFVLGEVITRRKMSQKLEGLIHGIGFIALLLLMFVVTYFDILKIYK